MTNPPQKLPMHTPDFTKENIAQLAELFPHCVTETHDENKQPKRVIDFDLLRQTLSSEIVKVGKERYQINWPGKTEALLMANTSIKKTLRPKVEESKDWETTQNLFIEGDNLDALKLLQNTYLGKVKMIYIDPPYNTGNDFIYKDSFKVSADEHKFDSGQADEEGNRLVINPESKGRFHSDWLSMMYPRLLLAHRFLRDDGVIFISIGDNEQANLKRMCDEVFGEDNFITTITRIAKSGGNKGDLYKPKKDYILFACKNKSAINKEDYGLNDTREYRWLLEEFKGKERKYFKGEMPYREKLDARPNQRYYIQTPDGSLMIPKGNVFPEKKEDGAIVLPLSNEDNCWTWSVARYLEEKEKGRFIFRKSENSPFLDEYGKKSNWTIYKKIFEEDVQNRKVILSDVLSGFENSLGTKEMDSLSLSFSYPKSSKLIEHLIKHVSQNNDDIILDFFAGSGTTAHAVMGLNAADGGNRKFICVQIPEVCDEKSPAFLAGYKTITEVSKERIRRAGQKILENPCHPDWSKDIGFRVLAVDSTNMKNVYYSPADLTQAVLENTIDNFKDNRLHEDLLFQVMLELGLDLSLPMHSTDIEGRRVFFVNEKDQPTQNPVNVMMACFERLGTINTEFCKTLARQKPARAVFRDGGFKDDCAQTNVVQIFKTISPNTTVKVL